MADGKQSLGHSNNVDTCIVAVCDNPPVSQTILWRYSAARLLSINLWGEPTRRGKTTDLSTADPWSNYSKK